MCVKNMDSLGSANMERMCLTEGEKLALKFTPKQPSANQRAEQFPNPEESGGGCEDRGGCSERRQAEDQEGGLGSEEQPRVGTKSPRHDGATAPPNTSQYLMRIAYEDRKNSEDSPPTCNGRAFHDSPSPGSGGVDPYFVLLDYLNRDFEQVWSAVTQMTRDSVEL